jgi:glycosyltransferase involved in cell wall biosynthesis
VRLLYLDILAPLPDRHASSVRTHQLLSLLRERGFVIDFAPFVPLERREQADVAGDLGVNLLPSLDDDARRRFLSEHAREYKAIVCAWTTVAWRFLPVARAAAPDAFLIFDSHDVNHLREYRQARVTGNQNTLRRALVSRARETDSMRIADCTLAISDYDAEVLRALDPGAHVEVVTMWCEPRVPAASRRPNVLFLGHYRAAHNHDAAIHLARDIWPSVKARHPHARLILAGSDPDVTIADLATGDISVPGWLPDLSRLFAEAAVFAAPLRFGAGIKGKMLQAMAHGVPIVASAIAAEGMDLRDGENYLRAESPDASASAILRLLSDGELAQRLACNAQELLRTKFTRGAVESQLDRVLAMVVARAPPPLLPVATRRC